MIYLAAMALCFRVPEKVDLPLEPEPGPSPAPHPSLPGQQGMSLAQARQRVGFPILVPARLGPPAAVTVSDHGRVVTLIYDRTPYGQVRLDDPGQLLARLADVRCTGEHEVRVRRIAER